MSLAGIPTPESRDDRTTAIVSLLENPSKPQLVLKIRISSTQMDDIVEQRSNTAYGLIDTGATRTAICEDLLDSIGAERWSAVDLKGATGTERRYLRYANIELLSDEFPFATFTDVEVVDYITHPDDGYKILLGMDILGKFESVSFAGFSVEFVRHANP